MADVTVYINGLATTVNPDSTILDAASQIGVSIPTLCNHPDLEVKANCRMCLVEVNGKLLSSCASKVSAGMQIITESERISKTRRLNLALILSHHALDCQHCARNGVSQVVDLSSEMCGYCYFCDCVQDGNCELQNLALKYNVAFEGFSWKNRDAALDTSTPGLVRDPNKCILCRRCVDSCNKLQEINVWSVTFKGPETLIQPALGDLWADSDCVQCGQCVLNCPTGALSAREQFRDLHVITDDPDKTVVASIDPNFLQEFSGLGGFENLDLAAENIVAGLRRVGFDAVWSGAAFADQTLAEVKIALSDKLANDSAGTIVAVADHAARTLAGRYAVVAKDPLSAAKRFGNFAKGHWAIEQELAAQDVYTVVLTSTLSAKAEADADRTSAVDLVLTPLEVRRLFHRRGADLSLLAPVAFDDDVQSPDATPQVQAVSRGISVYPKTTSDHSYQIASVQGLAAAKAVLADIKAKTSAYDLVYLSAIPGQGLDVSTLEV